MQQIGDLQILVFPPSEYFSSFPFWTRLPVHAHPSCHNRSLLGINNLRWPRHLCPVDPGMARQHAPPQPPINTHRHKHTYFPHSLQSLLLLLPPQGSCESAEGQEKARRPHTRRPRVGERTQLWPCSGKLWQEDCCSL